MDPATSTTRPELIPGVNVALQRFGDYHPPRESRLNLLVIVCLLLIVFLASFAGATGYLFLDEREKRVAAEERSHSVRADWLATTRASNRIHAASEVLRAESESFLDQRGSVTRDDLAAIPSQIAALERIRADLWQNRGRTTPVAYGGWCE